MIEQTEQNTYQPVRGHGRGFASMSIEKRRRIASLGGKAAHACGRAHKWSPAEAQAAGRKGGAISRRRSKPTPEELADRRNRIIAGEL
jgi:uncharacterized protein